MKLHGSDNRGRIIVKTYKGHLLTSVRLFTKNSNNSTTFSDYPVCGARVLITLFFKLFFLEKTVSLLLVYQFIF